ncbi:PblB [Streptococcus pneumoniae]|nr:PblB [Streptococcus pneumoniae]
MIYLTEGNTPLNEAYNDEIVHLGDQYLSTDLSFSYIGSQVGITERGNFSDCR